MSIIVFDMEWNMGYPKPGAEHFDEIIEIGAVKVENWQEITGQYKEYVRPTVHKTIHHHVRKMLPFTKQELKGAENFRTVIQQFKDWCGPDAQLVSWGNSDISVLQANLAHYHLSPDWVGPVYDLQAGYAWLRQEYTRQYGLKDAVEQFGIEAPEEFHDAANDAYYTALVGIAIVKQYGPLPDTQTVQAKREELRAAREAELKERSKTMEAETLTETEPLASFPIGGQATPEECLRAPSSSRWSCPTCAQRVKATGWSSYANGAGYITRGRCPEHGWQFAFASLEQGEDGLWHGTETLYPPTSKFKTCYFRFGHSKQKGDA
jgi:DNA polymerase III epsilon subunit-like protein